MNLKNEENDLKELATVLYERKKLFLGLNFLFITATILVVSYIPNTYESVATFKLRRDNMMVSNDDFFNGGGVNMSYSMPFLTEANQINEDALMHILYTELFYETICNSKILYGKDSITVLDYYTNYHERNPITDVINGWTLPDEEATEAVNRLNIDIYSIGNIVAKSSKFKYDESKEVIDFEFNSTSPEVSFEVGRLIFSYIDSYLDKYEKEYLQESKEYLLSLTQIEDPNDYELERLMKGIESRMNSDAKHISILSDLTYSYEKTGPKRLLIIIGGFFVSILISVGIILTLNLFKNLTNKNG